ncbi:MAG: pyridoxamine 5'-phosphate oxidase family protein [Solirubrobacterales bacterium]|nr:pyridoxamine 5'-phosphate oxidase family protein [Solirubrobacterales bacterium]
MLTWAHVDRHLRNSRNYWLATVRDDGRPHAMPVWGVWDGRALWFGTSPTSVKGRNLRRDPRAVVHLESGDDVVILEGAVAGAWSDDVLAAYAVKYATDAAELPLERQPDGGGMLRLQPVTVQAWLEGEFLPSGIRFRLRDDGTPVADGRPSMIAELTAEA